MGNYISPSNVTSWPSGCDASCQVERIDFAETLVDKILGRPFYVKNFDIEINGNGKNRIALPLEADIISIDHVYICNVELTETWYSFDENSVYLNLCGSGVFQSGAGILVRLAGGAGNVEGIFPEGHNNCRFVGTYGETPPQPIKDAIVWLVDAINEGAFGAGGSYKSEKIGRYAYTKGLTGYWKDGVLTGIDKVDAVLRHYIKQKKPIIMTP